MRGAVDFAPAIPVPKAQPSSTTHPMTYCVVPGEFAPQLHDVLRQHYLREPDVEVVVDRCQHPRLAESRGGGPGATPDLPPSGARQPARVRLVRRVEPADERIEDADSARLAGRFQAGAPSAFAVLYARYFDRVYAYLNGALADAEGAEWCVAEAFATAATVLRRRQSDRPAAVRPLLATRASELVLEQIAAQGLALDPNQRAARRRAAAYERPSPRAKLSDRQLIAALEILPRDERRVVVLRDMLWLSTDEAAVALDCRPTEASNLYPRGDRGSLGRAVAPKHRTRRPVGCG
jgi:DNA-directed RNA polymerase specialized sigma24 family protein